MSQRDHSGGGLTGSWPHPEEPAGGPGRPASRDEGEATGRPGDSLPGPALSHPKSPRGPLGSRLRWLATVVVSAAVGAAMAGGIEAATSGPSGVTIEESNSTPGAAVAGTASIPALVHRVLPAVVTFDVRTSHREEQGTGMVISPNGLVVTNDHVVRLAQEQKVPITVTRAGSSRRLPTRLVGDSPANDVALLRIERASGLPAVTFANSNKVVVGDAVVAIGNALGLDPASPTVTQGIVSALGRTVTASNPAITTETLSDMIQTDAAINPGSSGGPLIDSNGQVIGMNTAVAGTTAAGASAQNIGFAIPSSTIEALLPALERGKGAGGPSLGAVTETVTERLRAAKGLTPTAGALVVGVLSGSPAAAAGLRPGDVIVALDTRTIVSSQQLTRVLRRDAVGQAVAVTFYRRQRRRTVSVTLGTLGGVRTPPASAGARAVAP